MNPIVGLLRSRKALVALVDLLTSIILYFVGKYALPSVAEDINFLIGVLQVPVGILIAAIAYEDAALKQVGGTYRGTGNPVSGLLHSRKALVAFTDTIASIILYFVGKYCIPTIAEDINFLIVVLQVPVSILIGAIAYEDAALKRATGGRLPPR
jgi:TRAP-type C4-dicarboxylate transport system permease small subunit